ncbi:MAG: ABC transporter substrate-binding protein [Blautia sp.]
MINIRKLSKLLKRENPDIEINFEEVSDYATKILTEATAGDLPDLINCNTGTTQILANAGALQKFDVDALKADTEYKFDDFWDAAENYCTYDGDWYSLPLDGGNYGWVYNVDMFDKCGIEVPEDGFTWDEFTDACKTLMEHKDELGIEYPTIINDLSSAIDTMYPWITEAGGSYLNDDETCGWNSDETVAAFEYVKSLVDEGYVPAIEKLGDGYDALITKFNAGQIAMCRVALWNSTYLQDDVNWKAMNAPRANDGTQAEVLFLNGIGISSSCENPEAAEKFIKYLTSEEGLALYLEDNTSPQIAVRKSQADLSVSMFDENHDMKLFNTGLKYAGYIDLTETFADQQTIIGQYFDEIWHNDADIKSTLDSMADQLNGLLAQ